MKTFSAVKRFTAPTVLCAAAVVGGVALAADNPQPGPAGDSGGRSGFGVMDRPARQGDELSHAASGFGGDGARSRRVRSDGDETVWVVARGSDMCLVSQRGAAAAGSCAPASEAELGSLVHTLSDGPGRLPGEIQVQGLVPDQASRVAIRFSDGGSEVVPVTDNVYETTVKRDPVAVEWADGGQIRRAEAP